MARGSSKCALGSCVDQNPSAVVITRRGGTPLDLACENLEHVAEGLVKLPGTGIPLAAARQAGVQKEIQSIDVVVEGLLEVQPVCVDWRWASRQRSPAQALPTLRPRGVHDTEFHEKQATLSPRDECLAKIGGDWLDMPAANPSA